MNINSKIKEALLKKSQGDIIGSESIFLEILDISPLQYEVLINLGLINVHKKKYEESINQGKNNRMVLRYYGIYCCCDIWHYFLGEQLSHPEKHTR